MAIKSSELITDLGYVITAHGHDYRDLIVTFRMGTFVTGKIIIVYSPNEGNEDSRRNDIKKFKTLYNEILKDHRNENVNDINILILDEPTECLRARYLGFTELKKRFPDLEFVQFIDSGDYTYDFDYNAIKNATEADIFWAPVSIAVDEIKEMVVSECEYSSSSYNPENLICWSTRFIHLIKEDADKIIQSSQIISIDSVRTPFGMNGSSENISISKNGGLNMEASGEDCLYEQGFRANQIVCSKDFSMMCPSIVAYPWRVKVVERVFDYMIKMNISMKVNVGEDLLFHTIARMLLSKDGFVNCVVLNPYYHYKYYPTSLTHDSKYATVKEITKLNILKGFCANLIAENDSKCDIVESKDSSKDVSNSKNLPEDVVRDWTPYKGELPSYSLAFSEYAEFNEKMVVWNNPDSPIITEVVSYIPDIDFPVITLHLGAFREFCKIPKAPKKVESTWLVLGFTPENHIPVNSTIDWDGENLDEVHEKVVEKLTLIKGTRIEITQLIKLGGSNDH